MNQQSTMTSSEYVAATLAQMSRNDQFLVKGFILGLIEKSEQPRPAERREGA